MAFPPDVPLEKRFVGVFKAYLDDSGTHLTSDVVVVAGFISDASRWEMFSQEWQVALDDYHLDYFHMTDFENSQQQFRTWSVQERKDRLNRFLGIIRENTLTSVGRAVPRQEFEAIMSALAKSICGDAYGAAAIACFRSLAQIVVDPKIDGWVEYVLESGTKGRDALSRMHAEVSKGPEWRDNRILSLTFQDKRLVLPLQAADILAYELFKQLSHQIRGETPPIRYPLQRLRKGDDDWHYIDGEELGRINEWLSRPRT